MEERKARHISMGTYLLILLLLVLLFLQQPTTAQEVVFGMQTSEDGADSIGSSMTYDARTHRLYITGGTYGQYFAGSSKEKPMVPQKPDCFYGVLQLPQQVFMSPQWIRRAQIGLGDVSEACSDLFISRDNGDIYLLGHSVQSSSILSPLVPPSQRFFEPSVSGLVMHLNRGADLVGGLTIRENAVQYPVAVQADEDASHLFVASIKSDNLEIDPSFLELKKGTNNSTSYHFDTTTAGYLQPEYGSNFTILLKSLQLQRGSLTEGNIKETLKPVWSREFGLDAPDESIQVSGLLYASPLSLVMVGYTFHQDEGSSADGFVAVINPENGSQLRSQRVRSIPTRDDRILGVCASPSDSTSIYLVGITEGFIDYPGRAQVHDTYFGQTGAYRAFVQKMNIETMQTQWVAYMLASYDGAYESEKPPQIHGITCAVTTDGKDVYMAGTVKDGAVLKPPSENDKSKTDAKSRGGDDIFIAQYQASSGTLNFALQLGTAYEDSLGQGKSLTTTADGDAIILGNSKGSFMRAKSVPQSWDMFVLSVARKRGRHLPLYQDMMELDKIVQSEGISKSTNPYFFSEKAEKENPEHFHDDHPIDAILLQNETDPTPINSSYYNQVERLKDKPNNSSNPSTTTSIVTFDKNETNFTLAPSSQVTLIGEENFDTKNSTGYQEGDDSADLFPGLISPSQQPSEASQQPSEEARVQPDLTIEREEPGNETTESEESETESYWNSGIEKDLTSDEAETEAPWQPERTYSPNLRTRVPIASDSPNEEEKNKAKSSKSLALVVSVIVVGNIILGIALVFFLFSKKVRGGRNSPKVMPDPYLDESSKVYSENEEREEVLSLGRWKPETDETNQWRFLWLKAR